MNTEDAVTSIRGALQERAVSPLAGTWALSWAVINYKFFLIVFSELEVNAKMNMIEAVVFLPDWANWQRLLLYPSISAIFFIFVFPLLSRPVYWWWLKQRTELLTLKQKTEGKVLLTAERGQEIMDEARVSKAKSKMKIREVQEENDALVVQINRLEEKNSQCYADLARSRELLSSGTWPSKLADMVAPPGVYRDTLLQIERSQPADGSPAIIEQIFGDHASPMRAECLRALSARGLISYGLDVPRTAAMTSLGQAVCETIREKAH